MDIEYVRKKYYEYQNKKQTKLPSFNIVETSKYSPFWVQIDTEKLYNNIIELKINRSFFDYNNHFVDRGLQHEFTHIYDGIILSKKYDYNSFVTLMFFYSEFHASYEEMTYIIDDSKDLYNKCIYLPEPIPFKYFMIIKEQEFYRQMWDIKNHCPENGDYSCREMLYYFGYCKALKIKNESYHIEFQQLPKEFIEVSSKLFWWLYPNYYFNKIIQLGNMFNDITKRI